MDHTLVLELDKAFIVLKNNSSPTDHTWKTIQMLIENVMERQHEYEEQVAQHQISQIEDI